ncbi:stalk domain-containing protein [Bacillus solimangrovi]|uniref:Copper amine oxidase-like N-terminal domain-containing protein n=1 Tax=Bacillus solimangrovi TaxID=1305675 RepID=A0A1E5LE43_9BACI|nr:stalk domain-containing protein [Bacillus solimangrovi]OEH92340.1 hypothetical protein BFG57_16320 [Bacillus solimangrovi]
MKKSALILVAILLLSISISTVTIATEKISVYFDGKELTFNQPPQVMNGNTMVPLRGIFEELGAEVKWDPEINTVKAYKNEDEVILKVGSTTAIVNGAEKVLDQPAVVANGSVLVPLRFISEALNKEVKWYSEENAVVIGIDPVNFSRDIVTNEYGDTKPADFILSDGWHYYLDDDKLFRVRPEGHDREVVYEVKGYKMLIQDGWAYIQYYDGVRRVKLDGSLSQHIVQDHIYDFDISPEMLVYSDNNNESSATGNLYRTNLDGTDKRVLTNNRAFEVNISGEWIIFEKVHHPGFEFHIYKIKNDGTEMQKLNTDVQGHLTIVAGDWIYSAHNELYRMKQDGTQFEWLTDYSVKNPDYESYNVNTAINIHQGWIYFVTKSHEEEVPSKLIKMKTDGTEKQILTEHPEYNSFQDVHVAGEWIYFLLDENNEHIRYRMKTDGSTSPEIFENTIEEK